MGLFKTKEEKELLAQMQREEQLDAFNELVKELKDKKQEYARYAAEAELSGNQDGYLLAVNGILEVEDNIAVITSTKTQFDIINLNDSIAAVMTKSMDLLNNMASKRVQLPNIRKIQKTQLKLKSYMRDISIANKTISKSMSKSNPANKIRSEAEIQSVRPLIEAELVKLSPTINSSINSELASEIENENNNII